MQLKLLYQQKFLCILLFLFVCATGARAQGITVSGKITGDKGEGLPGVTVLVKGTSTGTVSDPDGNFSISPPSGNSALVVSFVGYLTQEIALNNRTTINVALVPDTKALEEVVVVGYGERQKSTYTGSVASLDAKEITRAPVADISNNLVGRMPGLIATQRTGEPGYDGSNILIRGISTTGSNAPLIVIDGIPRPDYGFSQIDPNEIESISILKDAAAAAVFGVRGANGVILVTTKRGKAGKISFSFNTRFDFQVPTRLPQSLDAYNTALLWNEGLRNEGKPELYTPEALEAYRNGTNRDVYPNTDWFKEGLKSYAPQSQHNVNVSGGTERARYFVSAGFLNQDGLYEKSNFKRYNFRSNIDVDVTKTTNFRVDLAGRNEARDSPNISAADYFYSLLRNQPMANAYYANGLPGVGRNGNPMESARSGGYYRDRRNVFQSLFSITQKLPFLNGLSVKGQVAIDKYYRTQNRWSTPFPTYSLNATTGEYVKSQSGTPALGKNFEENQNITAEAHLNYARTFGNHNVSGLLLYTQTAYKYQSLNGSRNDYLSPALDLLDVGGVTSQPLATGGADERARRGVVGRATYDFASKYLFEANFRYDGSENFPSETRWGFFPSVSVGWRVSEEAFMKNITVIDNLKIRGSWGQLGNDLLLNEGGNPDRFAFLAAYNFGRPYVFNGVGAQTIEQGRLPNTRITWEKATSRNLGVEASFWQSKFTIEADFFYKKTTDILGRRSLAVPTSSGINRLPYENLNEVENKGVEFALGHNNQIGGVRYFVRPNFTFAKNTMLYAAEPENINPNIAQTGRSINQYFGLQALGLFQSEEEIKASPDQGANIKPGDIKYEDVNNDKKIDDNDRVALGYSPIPQMIYGLTLGATFKGLDANILFQGATRVSAYIQNELGWAFFNSGKALEQHLDRWTPDNPGGSYPRMTTEPTANNTRFSSYWLKDASYLRLKNVEIGYNFPAKWFSRLGISGSRVFVSGQNLLTWDKLKVADPEGPGASGNAGRGWFYPQQKVYSMGLNVNF